MALTIPKTDYEKLAVFLRTDPTRLNALYEALSDAGPWLDSEALVRRLEKQLGLDADEVRKIVEILVTLNMVRITQDLEPPEFASQISAAARATDDESLHEARGGWPSFISQLTKFLSLESSLGIAAKARLVAFHVPRHFHSSRIVTDARPIYGNDPEAGPVAFVILHTLELEVYEEGRPKDWYVSLNIEGLEQLKGVIERALIKEKSLAGLLAETKAPALPWSDPGGS